MNAKGFFSRYFLSKNGFKNDEFNRRRIMESDHIPYCVVLCIIALCQLGMLMFNLIQTKFAWDSPKDIIYRVAYIFLLVSSVVAVFVLKALRKKEKTMPYFVVCSLVMVAVLIWGALISIGDSYDHGINLTVYAYSTIGAAYIICLIPWISALNIISVSVVMTIVLALNINPNCDNNFFSPGTVINVLSICMLSILGNTFNFYRRMTSTDLEKKVISLNKTLETQAVIDDLTKQYNRRYLTQLIDTRLNTGDNPTGVILFDIDRFKNVNDTYGHLVGDKCLSDLGEIIKEFLAGIEGSYCVRYGGEEFLIYFDKTNKEEILNRANALREKVKQHVVTLDKVSLSFKISLGVALAEDNISYNSLINRADTALYTAKIERDSVCFYEE